MKKTFLIILMLSMFGIVAQVTPIFGFETGYNIYHIGSLENDDKYIVYDYNESLFIAIQAGVKIGQNLRFIGTYNNTLQAIEIDEYNPIQDSYRIDITYDIGYFTLKFEHVCNHPVNTVRDTRDYRWNSAKRAISISYYKEF